MGFGITYITVYVDSDNHKVLINIGKKPHNRYDFDSHVCALPSDSDYWDKQGVRHGMDRDEIRAFLSTKTGFEWLQNNLTEIEQNYTELQKPKTPDDIIYYEDFRASQVDMKDVWEKYTR